MSTFETPQPTVPASPAPALRVLSARGRIGRLRMIAYPTGLTIVIVIAIVLLAGVFRAGDRVAFASLAVMGLAYVVLVAIWTVRRVRDFDGPLWVSTIFVATSVLMPIVNLILWFVPGTKGENRHGSPPPPNSTGVHVLVGLMPVVVIVVVGATIAIPAYGDYAFKAHVRESLNVANVHRTALVSACQGGAFPQSLSNGELGLEDPAEYASRSIGSVAVTGVSPQVAEVLVTFRRIADRIEEGQTVLYVGTCRPEGVTWRVTGTIPRRYLPRF